MVEHKSMSRRLSVLVILCLSAIACTLYSLHITASLPSALVGLPADTKDLLEQGDRALGAEIRAALEDDSSRPGTQLASNQLSDSNLAHDISQVFKPSNAQQLHSKDSAVESLLLSAQSEAESISDADGEMLADDHSEPLTKPRSRRRGDRFSRYFEKRNNLKNIGRQTRKEFEKSREHSVRVERQRYHTLMRDAESDLSDGYPRQARHDLRRALRHHEEEQRLKGFFGREVDERPKAWKLLDQTVKDDLKDHVQAHRIEREMDRVLKVKSQVESARHQFEEEKELVSRVKNNGLGLDGLFRLSTREGGLLAEKSLTKRLQKSYSRQERAWLRAQALEHAKLEAAEKANPLAFVEGKLADKQTSSEPAGAVSTAVAPRKQVTGARPALAPVNQLATVKPTIPAMPSPPRYSVQISSAQEKQKISLGKERLDSLQIGGVDTPSDIALYGHELKLRKLHAEESKAGKHTKKAKVHTQATDEILVRLLSLAHAGLLHPHMSLGLSHRPIRHSAEDVHAEAMRDLKQAKERASEDSGQPSDSNFGDMIRKQIGSLVRKPQLEQIARANAERQARRMRHARPSGAASRGRAAPYSAAAAAPEAASALAPARRPSGLWGAVTWPMDYLFHDAKVNKVMVPS